MTPLNTIIEEEKKKFDERFIPNDGNIPTYIENGNDLKDFLTTAMQRAYEAGRESCLQSKLD